MTTMWTTLSEGRDGVMARGADVIRRTRETSAGLLGRAEQRASALQERLAVRRGGLNGYAIQRVERRVLEGLELLLGRVGRRLRIQIRWLAPVTEIEAPVARIALDAGEPARTIAARAPRKRPIQIAVEGVPVASAPVEPVAPKRVKRATPKKKQARPAARSTTRWVTPPVDVEELAKLPVKALVTKIAELGEAERRALLAHERSTKNRKSVISALSSKLPS